MIEMWAEPLRASVTRTHRSMFVTSVLDANNQIVAHVACSISVEARCGYFGDMVIDSKDGAPRQTRRAMVLLVRRSLTFAAELGISQVATDLPRNASAELRKFANAFVGNPLDAVYDAVGGHLADILTVTLNRSDEDGNEKALAR